MKNMLPEYRFPGARTLVNLNGVYLREFLEVWREAKKATIQLPETDHPGYQSLETLLKHVLGAARGYMVWMTEQLGLPDPEIDPTPDPDRIESAAEGFLDHLIERWSTPLAEVEEDRFSDQEYESRWGIRYAIESMLEHAVMHPVLHRVQLEELLAEQVRKD